MKRAALSLCTSLLLCACNGGGGTPSGTSSSNPTVNQTPAGGTFTESAFQCPTSAATAAGVARSTSARSAVAGRMVHRSTGGGTPVETDLAVSYDSASLGRSRTQIAAREQALGAHFLREVTFPGSTTAMRIVRAPAGAAATLAATLRAQPGVRSVGPTNLPRRELSVTSPLLTNDPFFSGLGASGAPLYQSAAFDGQWDKHVVRLEDAFAYSKSGNGSGIVNANALGSSAVKIAIIDSGEDTTHPDLAGKVAYQRCFITNPAGTTSISNFERDADGHGTSVSGVAAAATNNSLGFAGSGGLAQIYAYRVFPTPDDACLTDDTTMLANDPQCTSLSGDIITAINDAVSQKVNVINLSLGGDTCTTAGVDPDPAEGQAIANAVNAGIVVVAASGNDGTAGKVAPLASPACDANVIAVGATALSDGTANGSSNTSGSATTPREYVPTYSNVGSPAAAFASASAWGIVAPGGDPSGSMDADYLHWIDSTWTTNAEALDANYQGNCVPDTATSTTTDCRLLIAGTSLASPEVAGAAALIIAANSTYQSPAKMKQLLCTTADDIGDANEGCGRLDLYRAMAVAVGDANVPATRPVP